MLHRLMTDAYGVSAYLNVMADDPGECLGANAQRLCRVLARGSHVTARAIEIVDMRLSAVRRALVRTFTANQREAA